MYTLKQFLQDYPTDEACLADILHRKHPDFVCKCGRSKLYKVKGRPVYACACGFQIRPLSGTIFHGTKYPLTSWFYVLYLMSQSKNGISAAFVQRQLGCKYQTAWRMCMQIRTLMEDDSPLKGIVEVDETYIRAKPWRTTRPLAYNGRAHTVVGLVERGGRAKAFHIPSNSKHFLGKAIRGNVPKGNKVYTDGAPAYRDLPDYLHEYVNHSEGEWVRDDVHTQNIESFWSGVKLSLQGTHRGVTPQYLQFYLNERAFIFSLRNGEPFWELVSKL